jgi:hypothetical protein
MAMIYLRNKFHMPSSNSSLVMAMKQKAKKIFRMASTLFYILSAYHNISKNLLSYHTSIQDTEVGLTGASVTSQLRGSDTVLLLSVGI